MPAFSAAMTAAYSCVSRTMIEGRQRSSVSSSPGIAAPAHAPAKMSPEP
jgi:hypothetical protein